MTLPSLETTSSLSRLFEEQVQRIPNNHAVVLGDKHLTFQQLNDLSNQIARHLQSTGVGRETLVGVYLPRCVESVAAILGILKAGGAYVPLDTADPASRTLSMLQGANIKAVVTQTDFSNKLSGFDLSFLNIDTGTLAEQSTENLPDASNSDQLAYVLFTSGTTGQPKGVMIEQHSVIHLINALNEVIYSNRAANLRVSMTANLSFDASVKQLFQLLNGHTVYIVPEDARRDGSKLLAYIKAHSLDIVDCTPSLLEILLISGLRNTAFSYKPTFLVGGEPISQSLWAELNSLRACEFYNVYGPTECTVDATAVDIRTAPDQSTIGLPLPGVDVQIVDSALRPVPDSIAGEIVISGPGVARGYLNSPELTAEKFVTNPSGHRIYRTGDRGRKTTGGYIQFIGRTDSQAKIRGYRVELGEIESALSNHPLVSTAAVTVLEDGGQKIVAYVVSNGSGNAAEADLRQHAQSVLPDYMVPSIFVALRELPLTENGKVDKRLLPAPEKQSIPSSSGEIEDVLEQVLAMHWAEALRVESVGIDDDFFELGGNSIAATQMISNLQTFFPTDDPLLSLFFEDPTVSGLARGIRECHEEDSDPEEVARILLEASSMSDEEMEAILAE